MLTELFCGSKNYRFIHKPLSIDPLCLTAIYDNQYMQNSLYLLVCYFGSVVMTPEIHLLSNIIMGFVLILWMLEDVFMMHINKEYKVYHKKYAHGFCFAVLCCGYTLTDFPISIRLTSLALWQSDDCPSASKATLMNMDKYFIWIHYQRLHNHNKAKHNKTVCIFLGIYCTRFNNLLSAAIHISLPSFSIAGLDRTSPQLVQFINVVLSWSVHKKASYTHARTHTRT